MKRVIKIKEHEGISENFLKLSEVREILKILQDNPDKNFIIKLVTISDSVYKSMFGL